MADALVDPHVKVLNERVRSLAIERGLDALVYAPHYTPWPAIVEHAARFSDDRLVVVPAREVFTGSWRDRKHVLAMGLSTPVPDYLPLGTTLDALVEQGAVVLAPHPAFLTMSLTPGDVAVHRDAFAAIEVYNPKFLPHHARRARRLADRLGLPPFVSSYAHLSGSVGTVAVAVDAPVNDPTDVVAAFEDGSVKRLIRPTGTRRLRVTAAELGHLAWENTGVRLGRLARPGVPPTHPSAPLYGGRFERSGE